MLPAEICERVFLEQTRNEQLFDNRPINIRAAQEVVAAMIYHMNTSLLGLDDRRIKRATAEIIDKPVSFLSIALEAIGESCRHRFLKERAVLKAGELGGLSRGVALVQFKSSRDRNYGGLHHFTGFLLHIGFQRLQNFSREVLRFTFLAAAFELINVIG